MGRPLPRIPSDTGCWWLLGFITILVICGAFVAYNNYKATDQGGNIREAPPYEKPIPSPTVQDHNSRR